MPRATLLPTPASSTDIKGQDGSTMALLQLSFELPPPAIKPGKAASGAAGTSAGAFPMQASETVKSRKRSSAPQGPPLKDQFALPPPPTRSRKIIQMKPPREEPVSESKTAPSSSKTGASPASKGAAGAATAGGKKKQPSATSAAGRKIARKTAHSLIERRRRSKMNEEFAVLKSLVPACTGEMHKLAILQASIEYVRYLEDCVAKLKARQGSQVEQQQVEYGAARSGLPSPSFTPYHHPAQPDQHYADSVGDGGGGEDMTDGAEPGSPDVEMTCSSETTSLAGTPVVGPLQRPSVSPALLPADRSPAGRLASAVPRPTADHYAPYGYSTPATTSPAFGPQAHVGYAHSTQSASSDSALTSPALAPQRDLDQEATAALLMLNQMDRRGSTNTAPGRGMSVRDLLTT